jgi:hypothetical protein
MAALRESCHFLVDRSGVVGRFGRGSDRVSGSGPRGKKMISHFDYQFPNNAEVERNSEKND